MHLGQLMDVSHKVKSLHAMLMFLKMLFALHYINPCPINAKHLKIKAMMSQKEFKHLIMS